MAGQLKASHRAEEGPPEMAEPDVGGPGLSIHLWVEPNSCSLFVKQMEHAPDMARMRRLEFKETGGVGWGDHLHS